MSFDLLADRSIKRLKMKKKKELVAPSPGSLKNPNTCSSYSQNGLEFPSQNDSKDFDFILGIFTEKSHFFRSLVSRYNDMDRLGRSFRFADFNSECIEDALWCCPCQFKAVRGDVRD